MRKRIFAITFIIFLLVIEYFLFSTYRDNKSISSNNQLTTAQKLADFKYMYNLLKDNFADFEIDKQEYNYDWLTHKNEFEKMIKEAKSDKEFYLAINEILSKLNQCHTRLLDSITFKEFRGSYTKYASTQGVAQWANILNNPKTVKLYTSNNISFTTNNSTADNSSYHTDSVKNYDTKILESGKIAYLKINSFQDEFVKTDKTPLYEFLKQIRDYPYLIIDIQGNCGGNTDYWTDNIVSPLIKNDISYSTCDLYKGGEYSMKFYKDRLSVQNYKIKSISNLQDTIKYPSYTKNEFKYYSIDTNKINSNNYVGFNGKIFLLVDKNNFSASEAFAVFAKTTKWATLVGTNTGGDGIGTDPLLAVLPNSGLVLAFAGEMGINSDGKPNSQYGTTPDIIINGSTNDCIKEIKKSYININPSTSGNGSRILYILP